MLSFLAITRKTSAFAVLALSRTLTKNSCKKKHTKQIKERKDVQRKVVLTYLTGTEVLARRGMPRSNGADLVGDRALWQMSKAWNEVLQSEMRGRRFDAEECGGRGEVKLRQDPVAP